MTTTVRQTIDCETLEKRLDSKDAAIVRAVATLWADGKPVTLRSVADLCPLVTSAVWYRLGGRAGIYQRKGGGLLGRGWLVNDALPGMGWSAPKATLRPGPLFGGLGSDGAVYYCIEDQG